MTVVKYIAKPNTWFDVGTEAIPVTDFVEALNPFAVFRGMKDGELDEETCPVDEFENIPDDETEDF